MNEPPTSQSPTFGSLQIFLWLIQPPLMFLLFISSSRLKCVVWASSLICGGFWSYSQLYPIWQIHTDLSFCLHILVRAHRTAIWVCQRWYTTHLQRISMKSFSFRCRDQTLPRRGATPVNVSSHTNFQGDPPRKSAQLPIEQYLSTVLHPVSTVTNCCSSGLPEMFTFFLSACQVLNL